MQGRRVEFLSRPRDLERVSQEKEGAGSSPRGFGREAGFNLLGVGMTFCSRELRTSTGKGEGVRKGAWNSELEQRIIPER